jgi:4-amino-4-deoxy-L-arabinose transferase-like glycosyltransferase
MLKILPKELIIGVLAALLFIPFLGNVHLFDWDEINFAECAREMFINKDYGRVYINFMPFWEKPPFFFWLQVLSMHAFGVGDFAARFPNAICGIVTLVVLFKIGQRLLSDTFGLIWALMYAGSILPNLYFHSGIIDPWFNLFIFLSLYFFILYFWQKEKFSLTGYSNSPTFYIAMSGIFIGLALITKGPAALLIFGLTIAIRWIFFKFKFYFSISNALMFVVATASISMVWYGYEYFKNGPWFIKEFVKYNFRLFSTPDAGHGGFPGYHFVVLLVGCFPASLFFIHGHYIKADQRPHLSDFKLHMLILFWVVLVLFSIVKSKIVHYSSLCYFPLTYVAAYSAYHIFIGDIKMQKWIIWSLAFLGGLIGLIVTSFPFLAQNKTLLKQLLAKDPFAVANLDVVVNWYGYEFLVGIFVFAFIILSVWFFLKNKSQFGISVLFGGSSIMVVLILWAFIGRIESFSQGTAIEFFKSFAGKDCYVITYNYKSFAHYYYARVKPSNRPKNIDKNKPSESIAIWKDSLLLGSKVKKDVYLLTKFDRKEGLERYPELKLLWEKNGWSAFVRPKKEIN